MDPHIVQIFGSSFVTDDLREIELLTDLYTYTGEDLNVVFAVASAAQNLPNGVDDVKPVLRHRLRRSLHRLGVGEKPKEPIPVYGTMASAAVYR